MYQNFNIKLINSRREDKNKLYLDLSLKFSNSHNIFISLIFRLFLYNEVGLVKELDYTLEFYF